MRLVSKMGTKKHDVDAEEALALPRPVSRQKPIRECPSSYRNEHSFGGFEGGDEGAPHYTFWSSLEA